jgi:glutamate dehydrogenase/leucine dehydrogenase
MAGVHCRHLCAAQAAGSITTGHRRQKVVVVGAGWAGFGAAKHLAEQGANVLGSISVHVPLQTVARFGNSRQ